MNSSKRKVFVLAGMPRTATTFWYQRFQEHPSIFCPYRKESYFFSVNYPKGLSWYRDLFDGMGQNQIGADVTPAYFLDSSAIERIRNYDENMAVILGVRRPSDWALSWYAQVLTNQIGEKPSFEEFISGYTLKIGGGEIYQDFRNGFVTERIQEYLDAFKGRLCLYRYQLVSEDPVFLINTIERFLGIPQHFSEDNLKNEIVNASNRRNVGFLAYLLSQERLVDLIGRLLPRKVVQAARNAYVKIGTTSKTTHRPAYSESDIAVAQEIFGSDDLWVSELFRDSPVLIADSD